MDRNLAAFLAITEHGNLTVAAEKIGLTQPSLTKRLKNLEDELGCQLFDRNRRGMTLTPAGTRLYARAQRIEQEMLQAQEEIRSLEEAGLDVLRIGAGPLFHQRYIAPVFAELLRRFPTLRLDLTIGANEVTLPLLMKGEVDIVLGVIQPTGPDGALVSMPMTVLEHGLVLARDYGLGGMEKAQPRQMRDMNWVLYGDDKDTETWLNGYFQRNSLGTPNIAVRTASFATGLGLVREAGFVMLAPIQLETVIQAAGLKIVAADPPISNLTSGAYVRPSSLGFPAIRDFLNILRGEFAFN